MHPKTKIDYKKYSKDKNAKKIFDVMMKKNKIKNKDFVDIEKIFNLNLENSFFYQIIRKTI